MSKREQPPAVVKDVNAPTVFGPPMVSAHVTNPTAVRTARSMQGRHTYATPVAGGPTPPIPHLESLASKGLTMADQAVSQRVGPVATPTTIAPGGIFSESPAPRGMTAQQGRGSEVKRPPAIYPTDILTAEATGDPSFRQGHGAMLAASQPELAAKYGVIRGTGTNKRFVPPQELGNPTKGLRPETVAGMQTLSDLQSGQAASLSEQDKQAERDAVASSAGQAGRFGNAPEDGPTASPVDRIAEIRAQKDDFDFSTLRDMMMKDIINNDEQRKIIEERCKPMLVEELIMEGHIKQKVPILPGKLDVVFRSIGAADDLAIKRLIMLEAGRLEINEKYLLDKFSLMTVVLGVHSINNNPMPSYENDKGLFDEDLFWKKYAFLARNSFHLISALGVNFFWFDVRVRRLFVADRLGNG